MYADAQHGKQAPSTKDSAGRARTPVGMAPISYLETAVLYCDENLARLAEFPPECVDLIYLDPPFFSNRHYEVIWGDEAEVRSFEDRWDGGINVYLAWMRERLIEMRRILRPTGTIYLHCDWHAGHYLKVLMDDLFGAQNFLNEIIWHYRTSGGAPKKTLIRNHDTIFRYAKTRKADVTWNAPKEPWPESTLRKWQRDEDGRIYRVQNKYGKRYYVDPEGKLMDDVWEITLSSRTRERLGYPTQKPEALLDRIIRSSSNEGDIVLDPFCGCGTSIAVAHRLNREWIGVDISPSAVGVMKDRMATLGATFRVEGLATSEDDLRELGHFEFQNWVLQRVLGTPSPRKSGDMGIDGYSFMYHEPIQVKQSDSVGRNVVDNFETALQRSGKDIGYIVAFSFTKGAREEAARARMEGQGTIVLVTVADLLAATQAVTRPPASALPTRPREQTPDLMRLLSAWTEAARERPLPLPRPVGARPSFQQLVLSSQGAEPAAD